MSGIIKTWSYSAFKQWSSCPRKYAYERLDKLKPPPSPAAERGVKIHLLAENVVRGKITGMPKNLDKFKDEFRALASTPGVLPEQDWALTRDWKPTSWRAKNVWLRGKCDVHLYDPEDNHLHIIDHKTGRMYPDHKGQGELYASMGLGFYPELEYVTVEFWYLDQGSLGDSPFEYTRSQVTKLKRRWVQRGETMMKEKDFEARPSKQSCRFCPFRSDKQLANGEPGPCELWKKT